MYSPFVLPLTFFHCLVLYLIQSCSGQSLPLFTFARNLGRTRFWPLLFWGTTAIYIAMAWFWTLGERKEIFAALKGGGFVLRLSCVQKLLCAGRSMLRMYPWINPILRLSNGSSQPLVLCSGHFIAEEATKPLHEPCFYLTDPNQQWAKGKDFLAGGYFDARFFLRKVFVWDPFSDQYGRYGGL